MEVVIDIPNNEYRRWKEDGEIDAIVVRDALMCGKPLPKGHGDLKDIQEVIKEMYERASGLDSYGAYEEAEIVDFALNEFGRVIVRAERQRITESEAQDADSN